MNIFKVAACSFFDGIKQPVFLILLLFYLLIELVLPVAANAVLFQQQKMVIDSSLALVFSFGLTLTLFLAEQISGSEIRSGKALLFFTKPITPTQFMIGKSLALIGLLALFVTTCITSSALIVRATETRYLNVTVITTHISTIIISLIIAGLLNFYFAKLFTSTAVTLLTVLFFFEVVIFELIKPMTLFSGYLVCGLQIFFALSILCSLTTAITIKFKFSVTAIIILVLIFGGMFLQNYEFFSYVMPDLRIFWLTDILTAKKEFPELIIPIGFYRSLVFNLIFILFGAALLKRTEIGSAVSKS